MQNTEEASAASSEQPNPREETPNGDKKPQPDLPPDARAFRHPEHPTHGPPEPHARAVEAVVHLVREGRRVADLVADGHSQLFQLADFAREDRCIFGLVLRFEGFEDGGGVLASVFEGEESASVCTRWQDVGC